jgi:hypothetical protein
MLSMSFAQSRLRQYLLIVLFVLSVAWISGEASQLLLRWRAQKLLANIASLQAGRSTWSDVQPIMKRWDKWSTPKGACIPESCTYQIDLIQTAPPFMVGNPNEGAKNYIPRLIDHVGIRSSAVRAGFTIDHGVVTVRWFGEQVTPPVRDWGISDGYIPYVSASSEQTSQFRERTGDQRLLHPNRMVQHRDSLVAVTFSSEEDPAEQTALMDFHFSCITRLRPCENEADLLPEAMRMWQEQVLSRASR